ANWCGGVPNSTRDITIQAGSTNYPTLTTGTAALHDLTISTGGSFTVTGGTLQIAGDIANGGTFNAAAGSIEMNGATPQTIPANAFQNNTLGNLVINNNVSILGPTAI